MNLVDCLPNRECRFTREGRFANIMSLLQLAIILAWTLCAVGIALYAGLVAREITYVTLADGRRTERKIPLLLRLVLPLAPNVARLAGGSFFARQRDEAAWMIVAAGLEGLLTAQEFIALKIVTPVVCGGAWCVFVFALGALAPDSVLAQNALALCALGVGACYVYPLAWLRGALKRRHLEVTRALPFVLDLLTLSVEAGMDFISALQRNCAHRRLDALNEELIRMTREIQVGTPRRVALRNMSERVRLADLRSVTHALVQADELGVSIGSILRIQSEQLRARRFDRAERLANEAPVKMLGPLLLCIFPAVFLILLGPIISQASQALR